MQLLKEELVNGQILLQGQQGDSQATMKQGCSLLEIFNKIDNEMHMQELTAKIAGTTITFGIADKWVWKHNVAAGFSVKSASNQLQNLSVREHWSTGLVFAIKKL